ncbi:MAG: family 16 glycosylhydrolase [Bacteroidota bacterium]
MLSATLFGQECEHLIWHDEFRGNALDTDKWDFDIGTGNNGWGNNELQYYTNSNQNVLVEDGLLKIRALNQSFGGSNYTSSRIVTRGKFAFSSGRIEAKMKLPSGQGIWPAFWMLPEEWKYGIWPSSGEIDIVELLGQEPNKVYGTLHYGPYYPNNQMTGANYTIGSPNFADDFHVFSLEWTESIMKWSVDGVEYNSISKNDINWEFWPFNQDMHMLLNVAVGGNWPGPPNGSTTFPAEMQVEYIRVFQTLSELIIDGRETVIEGAATSYKVAPLSSTTFNWTVPAGASILSGQGSNEISVLWGNQGGTIEVETDKCCCMQIASRQVEVKEMNCEANILNANGDDELYWIRKDGDFDENIVVPNPNSVNNSSLCHRYTRNPGAQYDVLNFVTELIDNAAQFESGTLLFELDVYTAASPGTEILIQLEEHEAALGSFPAGRHSVYKAVTQQQNQWHSLVFSYDWSPDTTTPDNAINHLLFLFAPNSNNNSQFYIDNFRVRDTTCN